jgi:two-component system chemotaxis response regulator CheB
VAVSNGMSNARIVVVGASMGGVKALRSLAAQLESGFPAPILAVQHIGSHPSVLPELLVRAGPLPASHAVDGQEVRPGHIHVAPPDRHMLLEGDRLRVVRAARENHARPAIDPLFRSAALGRGPAVIGVLLTGSLDDGTAGLQAIKARGGTVVVQDPRDAEQPSMPTSALRHVQVDHEVALDSMGALITRLAGFEPGPDPGIAPERVRHENELILGAGGFGEHLEAIGRPSTFVCPDCSGSLWEVTGAVPRRFRCHTGHGYTLRALQHAQAIAADEALWGAVRALQEKEMLLAALAASADPVEASRLRKAKDETARHAHALRGLIEQLTPPPE